MFLGPLIRDIEVDKEGRVLIADLRESVIHVYNPDGSYQQQIGRKGNGPGEFQMIWALHAGDKTLYVLDYLQLKISVFELHSFDHINDAAASIQEEDKNQPS